MKKEINRVAVFCGSADGVSVEYMGAARELGRLLAERKMTLVYGGGGTGLMGEIARAALDACGTVIGVMPDFMVEKEAALASLPDLRIVKTMHERKALMEELADAFITLPGGVGTLEEFFEVWTATSLNLMRKPNGILNTGGYYAPLLAFLHQAAREGFVRQPALDALVIADQVPALLDLITDS